MYPQEAAVTNKLVKLDFADIPPTEGWKTIQSAFQSSVDELRFSLSNVLNYRNLENIRR